MQKTLKTCSRCGSPIRVERSVPASEVVCGRCDPAAIPQFENQHASGDGMTELQTESAPSDTRMTGAGLILFALGLVTLVVAASFKAGLNANSRDVGVDWVRGLSNFGMILGYTLIAAASLLSLFVPEESRRTSKIAVTALLAFLVVLVARVLIESAVLGKNFMIVWAAAAVVWAAVWSVYVLQVSEVVNRVDLGRRLAMLLPLPGLCLSIAWAANWLQAWQGSLALIRPATVCLALYIGWTAIRLGCVFLNRAADHSDELQRSTQEQLQPS